MGRYFGVDPRNVHAFIIGEHGDSELAVWSSANISGIDLDSFCERCHKHHCDMVKLDEIYENVKNSAYKIIEAKGATYYAIADAVRRIVSAIIRNEKTILTLSVAVDGEYGLNDICIGLPCLVGKDGVEKILEIPLSDEELKKLQASANALRSVIDEIEAK
jgi:L-lactate dehydrogenase